MKTTIRSINFDANNLNYITQLAKLENRSRSNLINEIIAEHYKKLSLRTKMKFLRIENIGEIE